MLPSYILSENAITVFFNEDGVNHVYTMNSADSEFDNAVQAVRDQDRDALITAITPKAKAIEQWLATADQTSGFGAVTISGGQIYYNGELLPQSYTVRKILDMRAEGLPVEPLLNFLSKLLQNPSKRAIDELMGFLEYGNMPITPEGDFLAYKRIRENYNDVHSDTISNAVGNYVSMPRSDVQDNPNITCSDGLHFCSREYLNNFSGERIVVLAINPKDVVSIPSDYNNTKGRCCAYNVIAELPLTAADNHEWDSSVVSFDSEEDLDDDDTIPVFNENGDYIGRVDFTDVV